MGEGSGALLFNKYFLGFFWYNRFNTRKDENWDAFNEDYYGRLSSYPRQWGSSTLGLKAGYKWLIKNHIIIEPEALLDYELNPISGGGHFDWNLILNIGYRF